MNSTEIKALINKYFEGVTTLEEEEALRSIFTASQVPEELQSYTHHFQFFSELKSKKSDNIPDDELVLSRIQREVGKEKPSHILSLPGVNHSPIWFKYAAGLALLVLSFTAGLMVGNIKGSTSEIRSITRENINKNHSLLTGLKNQSSASERILAINGSREMEEIDQEIAQALIKAMNFDENINVRLAAIEALSHFTAREDIRRSIIQSLELQDNPIIQIALIDLLVHLGEKKAINEIQRLMIDENTQELVKQRAEVGMALLM